MPFGSNIKTFFRKAGKWIKHAGKDIATAGKNLVHTVYSDMKSVVSFGGKEVQQVINSGTKLVDAAPGVITSSVNSIGSSLPWVAGIGVVGLIGYTYFNSKKRSFSQFSRYYDTADTKNRPYKYMIT